MCTLDLSQKIINDFSTGVPLLIWLFLLLLDILYMPPSESAAHYHGLRVHLQVIEWKVLDASANFYAEEWGWRINPVTTDKPVALDNVLKVIRCKCKSTSKNQCGSNVCTC